MPRAIGIVAGYVIIVATVQKVIAEINIALRHYRRPIAAQLIKYNWPTKANHTE